MSIGKNNNLLFGVIIIVYKVRKINDIKKGSSFASIWSS